MQTIAHYASVIQSLSPLLAWWWGLLAAARILLWAGRMLRRSWL